MSAFALPMPPEALAGLPSSAYGTLRYHPEIGCRQSVIGTRPNARAQLHQHAQDLSVAFAPVHRSSVIDVAQIARITTPQLRLLRRADRHRQIARELARRRRLAPNALDDQAANGLRRPSQLIGKTAVLLDSGELETGAMNPKRQVISQPKDVQVLRCPGLPARSPPSDHWSLITDLRIQSFGSRLEPRYIFGAETLV